MINSTFGLFTIDVAERRLLREGVEVPLPPEVFELLALLAARAGQLVTKDELMQSLWPGTVVDEANLTQKIFTLRKALGDDAEYIETVPGRGYRFIAPPALQSDEIATAGAPRGRLSTFMNWVVGVLVIAMLVSVVMSLFEGCPAV